MKTDAFHSSFFIRSSRWKKHVGGKKRRRTETWARSLTKRFLLFFLSLMSVTGNVYSSRVVKQHLDVVTVWEINEHHLLLRAHTHENENAFDFWVWIKSAEQLQHAKVPFHLERHKKKTCSKAFKKNYVCYLFWYFDYFCLCAH